MTRARATKRRAGQAGTPAPTAKRATRRRAAPTGLVAADRAAAQALAAMGEDVESQLAALAALAALVARAEEEAPDGVLVREARRLHAERRAAVRAWHLGQVEERAARHALSGDPEPLLQALAAAHAALEALGEAAAARALAARRDELLRGGGPRPFFARFLEHQRR